MLQFLLSKLEKINPNYLCPRKNLDIVTYTSATLCFVESKAGEAWGDCCLPAELNIE